VQEFENSKERTKGSIKRNEVGIHLNPSFGVILESRALGILFAIQAKLKLLKQLNKHGYQAFLSTYEICSCTERLEEFEGKNADEAQQICGKYLHTIKATFNAAGIDLDSIKKEANSKQKDKPRAH
jgi:hypothetical protein